MNGGGAAAVAGDAAGTLSAAHRGTGKPGSSVWALGTTEPAASLCTVVYIPSGVHAVWKVNW